MTLKCLIFIVLLTYINYFYMYLFIHSLLLVFDFQDTNIYEPQLVASTITHMLGHNLGMGHDHTDGTAPGPGEFIILNQRFTLTYTGCSLKLCPPPINFPTATAIIINVVSRFRKMAMR